MIQNGTDNAHEMKQDHTVTDLTDDNDDPPKSLANLFFRGRWWVLKDNKLYWSDAYPSNYAGSFDRTTNAYKIPVGEEKALLGLRDTGIICLGKDEIWGINPSVTPAATDKAEKLLDMGCVEGDTAQQVGDDILFLAKDGVRGLFRTIQDKLQLGSSYPLSYSLKNEFENINWAQVSKACAIYFDNKYFISLPTGTSTYNNEVWVYYPALNAWVIITGWNVAKFAKVTFSGEERLYAIDSVDGKVYRAWYGYDDNGVAINYQEEGRQEDLGYPLHYKSGGEVEVICEVSGNYNVSVYVNFDNTGYTLLGTINLAGNLVTFPTTFPVNFPEAGVVSGKFHLDSHGRWKNVKVKIQHNALNGNDDIVILQHSITGFLEEYENE